MSELDKKIQRSHPDLVNSVLEAQEKRNVERVDVLITNALKQLKMSRFKPDQSICFSLIYLARVSPKCFSQSANIKELLKSHIKRDNGPSSLKASIKNDFILPVLAANILLACADSPEVRIIILKRIEQWMSSNQKITENVQHLLALLCVRCQGDAQTVQTLIEMRHHWFGCIDTLIAPCGTVALDLCDGVRKLLNDENSCHSLVENLTFLLKHDKDVVKLAMYVSELLVLRPISVSKMLGHDEFGRDLQDILLQVYKKLFEHLKVVDKKFEEMASPLYAKFPTISGFAIIDEKIIEAILFLLATIDLSSKLECNHDELLKFCTLGENNSPVLFCDSDLKTPYELPIKLRQKLIQSNCDSLIETGLHLATPTQLAEMLQQFGTPKTTLKKILDRLNKLDSDDVGRLDIRDTTLFGYLLDYLSDSGLECASELRNKMGGVDSKDSKDIKTLKKIKIEA